MIINKKIAITLPVEQFVNKFLELTKPVETDTALLDTVVLTVISTNEKAVAEYKSGKQNVIMFLMGQVMKQMKGKADASIVKKTLEQKINS